MFEKYNNVLRFFSGVRFMQDKCVSLGLGEWDASGTKFKWRNRYTTTIHSINSCVLKASKLTRAATVYRGIAGGSLPPSFWESDEAGKS